MSYPWLDAWRDIDSERRYLGVVIWTTGLEVHLGRRLYRLNWGGNRG